MVNIWAVITTHNRHESLAALVDSLDPAKTVIVDNRSNPPVDLPVACIIRNEDNPPNISKLWNLGLDAVAELAVGPVLAILPHTYEVAVLNDDLEIPPGTLERLAEVINTYGAAIAHPDQHGRARDGQVVMNKTPGPVNLFDRMSGYCYMLRGELGLRLNETLKWWYSDDDLEWRAAGLGGVARVGGTYVTHKWPNSSTHANPDLAAQTALDRKRFIEIWGKPPW